MTSDESSSISGGPAVCLKRPLRMPHEERLPREVLPRSFYDRSAAEVAPDLLGHWLVRNGPDGASGGVIVETEAYLQGDPACHAFKGRTARNQSMWGAPGHAYVYLIYGFHFCLNAVCQPAGSAEAVLIRALHPLVGIDLMRARRSLTQLRDLTSGPGKIGMALAVDRSLDGVDLCAVRSPLSIRRHPEVERCRREWGPVITGVRIGITQAADWPLRFFLAGNESVSRRSVRRAS